MKIPPILYGLSLIFLYFSSFPVFAKAPDSAKIVFVSNRDGNREIYIMDPDGGRQRNLTRHGAEDLYPVWSPTGENILFVSDRHRGRPDLYLMDADGSHVRRVFREGAHREKPTWAPDGRRIAYVSYRTHTLDIATIDGDLVETVAPIGGLLKSGDPAWSPDGTEIAFNWAVRGKIRIFNLHTRRLETFSVNQKFVMFYPAWSPDGSQLAFSGVKWPKNHVGPLEVGLKATIYIADRHSNEFKKVIGGVNRAARRPVWAPRGDALLYDRNINLGAPFRFDFDDGRQIFKIALGSHYSEQLTHDGSNYMADWFDPTALRVSPQSHLLTTTWAEMKGK